MTAPRVSESPMKRRRRPPTRRYNVTVPIEPYYHHDHSSYKPVALLKQLPTPLRFLVYVVALNLSYFFFFSTHHHTTGRSLAAVETSDHQQQPFAARNLREATKFPVLEAFQAPPATVEPVIEDVVLVVIVSDRLSGIIPTVSSILNHTVSKPIDLVLIGDHNANEKVRAHFDDQLNRFISLTVADVQADLVSQGIQPIWTWPAWGSSRSKSWRNENTLHVADWDELETHAHELNHLRFYLPLMKRFRSAKYLYFLDDDILVQKDLGHVADATMESLDPSRGLVTPCNIWVWNSDCHHFEFQDENTIKSILEMPSLYLDRHQCQSEAEIHCYPANYLNFVDSVMPNSTNDPRKQKAWNFGFSLFALDNWRQLDLTGKYEAVMKESYRKHIFPETSLTFGLGVSYIAFAGAVECWNDQSMNVRDGFGFIEWSRYEATFGKDFFENVDVVHYTGPHKPWAARTPIEPRSLEPWLKYMKYENLTVPEQLPEAPAMKLFTLLSSDRSGAQWIMGELDSHPSVCASGEGDKPESGFPVDVLIPEGTPWFPVCSIKRGCSYGFIHDAVLDLVETMDLKGRTGVTPVRCSFQQPDDPLGHHLPRVCNFVQALNRNYDEANIAHVWVEAFRNEDQSLLGCSCPRGTTIKGLKVLSEWLVPQNFPFESTGPADIVLDDSPLSGSKVIRLKRRNLWARYKSTLFAQQTNMYHLASAGDKKTELNMLGNITVSIDQMLRKFLEMTAIDKAGDQWAKQHASEVLWLDYEVCRDDTTDCFERIFAFLDVDPSFVYKEASRFESTFASFHTDSTLDHIANKGAVIEALSVNGYGQFIDVKNIPELQLLIYDETEALDRTHSFHQEKGINATIFGRSELSGERRSFSSKFSAAVPLLQDMPREALVVLSDNPDVRINFPGGNDAYRYEAIYDFRAAYKELTQGYPGAVIVSAETHCCASALTHGKPGDFFAEDGQRRKRSCLSGQPGCKWTGDENAWPWQSFMQELAYERSPTTTDNQYLDASLIAGKAGDLLKLIKATDIGDTEDNRAVLTDYMHHSPDLVLLDYEQRLFGKNREGLQSETNKACPFGGEDFISKSRSLRETSDSLFMHTPRDLGCLYDQQMHEQPIFPRWSTGGVDIKPILDHIDRVAEEIESIVLPPAYGKKPDYNQGPEIPYFMDENAVWSSRLIRDRTDPVTLKWRTLPTEALLKMAHKVLKRGGPEVEARWSALKKAIRGGGFPYWSWYGDYKSCNFHNHANESIPILTTAARADCDHAFPMPNYMLIIDAQKTSDNWRGLFRDTKKTYPWESKHRQVVWRGSLSEADRDSVLESVRWRANKLIHELNSDLYDVGLTSVPPWISEKVDIDTSLVGGLLPNIDPMSRFQEYKAILDMDGNSWSSRFSSLLCYNSLVIKIEPKYLEYFYSDLKPWTHYIPVKGDLSDLHENIAWALDPKNEHTIQDIITSANEWCSQRLVPRALASDLLDIFESYVRLLNRANPDWQQEWLKKKSLILSATSNLDLFRLK